MTLADNLAAADAVLTTSVAEGFGLAFLESVAARRPLVGRDLPDVTEDFRAAGIDLPHLYPQFRVELSAAEAAAAAENLRRGYDAYHRTLFGRAPAADAVDALVRQKIDGTTIDFGDADERLQATVLRRLRESVAARERLLQRNPAFAATRDALRAGTLRCPAEAAVAVDRAFGLRATGERLRRVHALRPRVRLAR